MKEVQGLGCLLGVSRGRPEFVIQGLHRGCVP